MVFPDCIPESCHKVRAGSTEAASICTGGGCCSRQSRSPYRDQAQKLDIPLPAHTDCPLLYNWDGCVCLCLSDNVNICLPTAKVTPIWLLPLYIPFCGSLLFMLLLNLTMYTLLPSSPFISDEPQNWNLKVAHTFLQVLNTLICLNPQSFDGKGNNMMFVE